MAGKPGHSGGKREGAGRKPASSGKVGFYCQLPPVTRAAIRRLSDALGISQSEVVDRAMMFLIEVENAMKEEQSNDCE